MASELENIHGFHKVNNLKARELLQPHLQSDGHYLLRPSSDSKGGVLCTICVTNKNKLMNYRLVHDSGRFYIHNHTSFPAIHLLLAYYKSTPINAEANTRLLYPVGPPPQVNTPTPEVDDAYVIMERQLSPTSSSNEIPGLHTFLPKSEVNTVMAPYIGRMGHYLLRPSSTSEGQLTLAVSHIDQVLNFKINCEQGQYFISAKKLFNSIPDLISHYHSHPIRSKKAGNSRIQLLYPIPVNKEKEKLYQKMLEEKEAARQQAPPPSMLAPGWTEHWHNTYNRYYYYNTETGESLWEKPLAPPTKQAPPPLPDKTPSQSAGPSRMRDRPLPTVPGMSNGVGEGVPHSTSDNNLSDKNTTGRRSSRKFSRPQQPLPPTPGSQTLPYRRKSSGISERDLPPLPPKEESNPPARRGLPPLPPKEESSEVRGRAITTGMANRPPMPIPSRGPQDSLTKSFPPLPPKEDTPVTRSTRPAPPLPGKANGHPPLPGKTDRPMPPLPPKADPQEPTPIMPSQAKPKRKKVIEYEDIVPKHQPAGSTPKNKIPPPLPQKDTSYNGPGPSGNSPVPSANGPPPPPPPPAIGAPPPPPLPPVAPPSSSTQTTTKSRSNTISTPSPQSSPGSGRPFTAGDLASQRSLLKKRGTDMADAPKKEQLTGFASVLAGAIDTRRKAMEDSEESDFEDIDDVDDWDD